MSLAQNFTEIIDSIAQTCLKVNRKPDEVRLITVTKTHLWQTMQSVLDLGHCDLGENKVQEIVEKVPLLSGEKTIHLIGHLQSNKVNKVVGLVDWIHSIDSEDILLKVAGQCDMISKKVAVLIQVNTSHEETKSGCEPEDAVRLCRLAAEDARVVFKGLMTIGPLGGNEQAIRKSYSMLRELRTACAAFAAGPLELSMGMSDDYEIAIEEGSTMVRIGSKILGQRVYG